VRPKGFEPLTPWFEEPYSKHRKLLENKALKTRHLGILVVLRNRQLFLHMPLKLQIRYFSYSTATRTLIGYRRDAYRKCMVGT
jgi:hypothetical protein